MNIGCSYIATPSTWCVRTYYDAFENERRKYPLLASVFRVLYLKREYGIPLGVGVCPFVSSISWSVILKQVWIFKIMYLYGKRPVQSSIKAVSVAKDLITNKKNEV